MNVVLEDIETSTEWQCAHDALNHAVDSKQVTLTYETPEGDLTIFVVLHGENVIVSKKDLTLSRLTTKG